MKEQQKNRQVAVFLQGKLENGEVFEETPPDHPVVITLGQDSFFPAIENELYAMVPGETRTFTLTPEQAYGPHHEKLVQTIDRSVFGGKIDPQPGMILSLNLEGSEGPEKVPATVLSVSDSQVTVDYNHPLAGQKIIYVVTIESWLS